ncbi:1-aminocyclopropane-1-carboxylate oxidase homolog 11-like [Prunus yedoensis var. nudiflora]|uniref:1-aminocyclopropane-1-carboxylate oxidase homolog 11-like n=1 Tax=Prunus yedoensis var. nudiflora TaxID=2094558 RepID=A0A314ZD48_PRUYE|nr:1-aminocyclopropane-1-carboxylate oxidase homolog 11-like [Prunus yedoensis var. nudiflora]
MVESIRRFHEQPQEAKMEWYSRDFSRKVNYYSSGDIKGRAKPVPAEWKDTLSCRAADDQWDFDALPELCRSPIDTGYLKSIKLSGHYYPACPEPDLTLGTIKHSDPSLLTLVLQDKSNGLQVLHNDQWVDVPLVDGAFVANIGDFMQLLSNDKFMSVKHRVLASPLGRPRISAVSFFLPSAENRIKPCGPIKELLFDNSPPIYRITSYVEFMNHNRVVGQIGGRVLPHFKL